ncbi:OB-fold protein [Bacillus cereus]
MRIFKWGYLISVILIFFVIGGIYFFEKRLLASLDDKVKNPSKEEYMIVNHDQYVDDYTESIKVAEEKYQGKVVEITGFVKEIGTLSLELEGNKSIQVLMQKHIQLSPIKIGDMITIRGIDGGYDQEKDQILIAMGLIVKK